MSNTKRLLVLFVAIAASSRSALADPKEESKQHFDAATAAHKEGHYAQALNELLVAYALDPRNDLLYAIGQIYVKLGQCPQAVTFYERFLGSHPKPESAARATKAIDICKTAPPAAAVEAPDLDKADESLEVAAAENLRRAKEAEAVTAIQMRKTEEARIAAQRERERDLEKLYNHHPARKWAIIGAGVGAATLIAGGAFGMLSRSAQSSFANAGCGDRTQRLAADLIAGCANDLDRGEKYARVGNVLMGVGGVVFAASAVVFVLDPGNVERPELGGARVTLTPTSIQLTAHW